MIESAIKGEIPDLTVPEEVSLSIILGIEASLSLRNHQRLKGYTKLHSSVSLGEDHQPNEK